MYASYRRGEPKVVSEFSLKIGAMSDDVLPLVFKGGSVVFVGLALDLFLSFLAKLLMARYLGTEGFGAVVLGITLLTLVSVLVVLGLDQGVGRYLPRYEDAASRRGVIKTSFRVGVLASILAGAAVVLLAGQISQHVFHDPSLTPVLRVFGAAIPFAAVMRLAVGVSQGMKQSLPKVAIKNMSLPVSRLALVVAALLMGFGALGVAWGFMASYVIAAGVGLAYVVRRTELFSSTDAEPMRTELLAYSAPLMVAAVMERVFSDIDSFILGYYASTGDVGVYGAVYSLSILMVVVLKSFGFVYMPAISEFHSEGRLEEMASTYTAVTTLIFLTTLPVFFAMVFLPELLISLSFGSAYTPGTTALTVLAAGFMVHAVMGPNLETLSAIGETRKVMRSNVVAAVVNVALNLVLIPRYSFLGAAVATTASYALMNLLYSWDVYRTTGILPKLSPGSLSGIPGELRRNR